MSRRTHRKKIGQRPFSGLRFVQDGKVRIEWWPEGRRHAQTIGPHTRTNIARADEALTAALELARAERAGEPVKVQAPAETPTLTIGELFDRYGKDAALKVSERTGAVLRPATIRLYAQYAKYIIGWFERGGARAAASLGRQDVKAFIRRLREMGLGGGQVKRIIEHLRQVYRWAVSEEECLSADPISGIKSPKHKAKTTPYTRDESRRLYDALHQRVPDARGNKRNDWRFRLVTLLTCIYGVRVSQAINLLWADVDLDRALEMDGVLFVGTITWKQDRTGSKGQEDRLVPLLPVVRDALVGAWTLRQGERVVWGWQDPAHAMDYTGLNRGLHALEERAGVETIPFRAFHSLRRGMMTVLVEDLGVNQAAALTGDTPAVIMRDYVRPTTEAMGQAMTKVNEMFPAQPRANRVESDGESDSVKVTA